MIPVVTPRQMREIDASADVPVEVLIERAGSAVARAAIELLGGAYGRTVAVIAGPGNNGADGRIAADHLRRRGVSVVVFGADALPDRFPVVDLVIDAAFGTGFRGSWTAPDVGTARVLAVDITTGLDPTTGDAAPGVLAADATVTFAAAKPGHVLGRGRQLSGRLTVADIGLDVTAATMAIVDGSDVAAWLPAREHDAHKWRHAVRLVAGSPGMTGAARLAGAAALRTGASMVVASTIEADTGAGWRPEIVSRPIIGDAWSADVLADLQRFSALVIGPGIGRQRDTPGQVVRTISDSTCAAIVDGDALYALSVAGDWPSCLLRRSAPTVLTPHDGEFEQLAGRPPGPDRVGAARHLAELTGAVVLLKGPTTVVAAAHGQTWFVTNGDDRLATAGTGDVLAGIIGALMALRTPPIQAAAGGAWIHAAAGAKMARRGLVAGDLIDAIPLVLNECAC